MVRAAPEQPTPSSPNYAHFPAHSLATLSLPSPLLTPSRACHDSSTGAVSLIDDSTDSVEWASVDHCAEFCKNGHIHTIVKVLTDFGASPGGRIARVAKKMSHYDAISCGAHVISSELIGVSCASGGTPGLANFQQTSYNTKTAAQEFKTNENEFVVYPTVL